MNRGPMLVLAALVLVVSTTVVRAADSFVACPVDLLETGALTPLTDGWWATPVGGKLAGTEIGVIGGQKTLVCNYQGRSQSVVPVMHEMPPGVAGCAAARGGFKCTTNDGVDNGSASNAGTSTLVAQARADAPTKQKTVTATGQARADAPVKEQSVEPVTQARADAPTATKGADRSPIADEILGARPGSASTKLVGCPDPSVASIVVRGVNQPSPSVYNFVLAAAIRNEGAGEYRSSAGQQEVQVFKKPQGTAAQLVQAQRFGNLAVRGRVEVVHREMNWSTKVEFPADFEFVIVYDPDIKADGNSSNDDCRAANNRRSITGAEINAQLAASRR